MYRVIKGFIDLQDNNHSYKEGDSFPREGAIVLSGRYYELATDKNRQGVPLIEEIVEDVPRKRTRKTDTE